ncbi:hypothetical protein [Candidatus Ichthyocystis sparus]|uniref:hypothetical protein n=1 Tax=Candidatus Ichthyocystis sparus TaxID=1561004 RepID=UPI000A6E6C21|nr:hypothetical protein [Candidatus Ichthyocystis sparus]
MYPVSAVPESSCGVNKEDTLQAGGLQQVEASSVVALSAANSNAAASVGEGMGTRGRGKDAAQKSTAASTFTVSPGVFDSLGVKLHPDSAQVINDILFKVSAFAKHIYKSKVGKQLPPDVSNRLTVTGRAIWYGTYRMMCEANFLYRCLREYHFKHRPNFVRALPKIRVLSDSSDGDVVPLPRDGLLDFLSKLDCAVRTELESVFNCAWGEVVNSTLSALEGGSLSSVACKDVTDVLEVAGVPAAALSAACYATRTISKGTDRNRGSLGVSTPSLLSVSAENDNPSSSTTRDTSSSVSPSVECVDLMDVKLHPDSARLIHKLFYDVNHSAKTSRSRSVSNYLSEIMNSKLSVVGKAIWCRTYRELHLVSFVSRCLCIYHSKYRPEFIRTIGSIRVLSSSNDTTLVPLSGGGLLGFLSRLDCTVRRLLESIFDFEWNGVANRVFAGLEDESLSDVCCKDIINVLDVADIPVVALSVSRRYPRNKSKKPESSSKATCNGTNSVDPYADIVCSSSDLQFQFALPPQFEPEPEAEFLLQPEPELLPQPEPELLLQPEPEFLPQSEPELLPRPETELLTQYRPELSGQCEPELSGQCEPELSGQCEPELLSKVIGSSLSLLIDPVAASIVTGESLLDIGEDVLVSTTEDASPDLRVLGNELSAPSSLFPLFVPVPVPVPVTVIVHVPVFVPVPVPVPVPVSSFPSELKLRAASGIYSASPPPEEDVVLTEVVDVSSVFGGGEGESLSPSSSFSVLPISSSSPSLSSYTSESGCNADLSSFSPESPVPIREVVGLAGEGAVSAPGVLDESYSVISREQLVVPTAVYTTAIGESYTAAGSSSSYFLRSKNIMRGLTNCHSEVPASNDTTAGPSSSASVGVSSLLMSATGTAAEGEDVGVRLSALLSRELPPADESSGSMGGCEGSGGRGRFSSSHRGSAQRGRGRKRKRE